MKQKVFDLLEKHDHNPSQYGIEKILDTWEVEKRSLLNLFRNHPNWIEEEKMIKFSKSFEKGIDVESSAFEILDSLLHSSRLEDCVNPDFRNVGYCLISFLLDRNKEIYISEEVEDIVKYGYGTSELVRFVKKGTKTTRVIRKLCDFTGFSKVERFESLFASYSDCLSTKTYRATVCISLNPLDYLLMSNGNSWTSCHTINEREEKEGSFQGCNKSGTISYMLDATSFVFYTVKDNGEETLSLKPKISREMFSYEDTNGLLIQGRLYPNSSNLHKMRNYLKLVQEVISTCANSPNTWEEMGDDIYPIILGEGATVYPDWEHDSSNFTLSKLRSLGSYSISDFIEIGVMPLCVNNGCTHTQRDLLNINDSEDDDYVGTCSQCGCNIYSNTTYRFIDGDLCCESCYSWCDHCLSYHPNDSFSYTVNGDSVCEDGYEECPNMLYTYITLNSPCTGFDDCKTCDTCNKRGVN